MRTFEAAPGVSFGDGGLVLIGGPCAIEGEEFTLHMAGAISAICQRLSVPYVFKASYDKANRTSIDSYRGPGIDEGLRILERVQREIGVPLLTDIHEPSHAVAAARVVDILQIPAFLCRQTDLLSAAGATGRTVNVKKGQFVSPAEMAHAAAKVATAGCTRILLTERGSSFGYNHLVVDMKALPMMRELDWPVVFDATHSVQLPGGLGNRSGGQRQFVPHLARAAVAVGVDGLFMEIHEDPDKALSDGPNMVALADLEALLEDVLAIHAVVAARRQP